MAAKKNEVQISIPEIKIQQAQLRITGTSPLVVHKFSEKAKRMMLEKQMKTAKANAKDAKNPVEDFMQSLYWLTPMPEEYTEAAFDKAVAEGARFGFPATGVKQAAVSAAYRNGLSKDKVSLYGAFHINADLLEIPGGTEGLLPLWRAGQCPHAFVA
jgi:hypothetical protein